MKRFLLTASVFILLAFAAVLILSITAREEPAGAQATINGVVFNVEIADTALERSRGLSGRQSLAEDAGMLFIFPEAGRYNFWMKGMNFPIDFIWINGDKVVGATENAPSAVEGEPIQLYIPPEPADKVLEVAAGTVARVEIKKGDNVVLK